MYLIQITIYKYGQIQVHADNAKVIVQEYIDKMKKAREPTLITISVVNTETGEIHEVWNNKNTTLFGNS